MTEQQELKCFYLETQNKNMAKLYTKILSSTLTLDQKAIDELKEFFLNSNLSSEIYANTINLHTDEDGILEYLKLFKSHTEILNRMEEVVDLDFIEKGSEKTINNFIEHHSDVFNKIYEGYEIRKLQKQLEQQ
tara:strand:- start:978 stop:1376 length:399 start_codon:yes stop_codon:yes gene_type:complete